MPPAPLLAHPLTETDLLPVSPLVAAAFAACIVLAVGGGVARTLPAPSARRADPLESWADPLPTSSLPGRLVGVAALVAAIVAGRYGVDSELDNLAPTLIVGVAWPLLVAVSAAVAPVWRYLDPWDSIARLAPQEAPTPPPSDVSAAIPAALALTWYLSANTAPFSPRAVGAALAIYSIATLAACFAAGRRTWLSRGEIVGLFLSWCALGPARRLGTWSPPRGASAVLGILFGGLLFGTVRTSELWGQLNAVPAASLYALGGLAGACLAGVAVVSGCERWARTSGAAGSVTAACVPATAALAVSVGLLRDRFTTSLQLLPGALGDPFGWGWDLLGEGGRGLDPSPFGDAGLVVIQLVVLAAGALAGVAVVALRRPPGQRWPSVTALALLLGLATASFAAV